MFPNTKPKYIWTFLHFQLYFSYIWKSPYNLLQFSINQNGTFYNNTMFFVSTVQPSLNSKFLCSYCNNFPIKIRITWSHVCNLLAKTEIIYPKNVGAQQSMAKENLNKSKGTTPKTSAALKVVPYRTIIQKNWNPPFRTTVKKFSKEVFFRLTFFFSGTKIFCLRNNFCSVFYVL